MRSVLCLETLLQKGIGRTSPSSGLDLALSYLSAHLQGLVVE